MNLRALWTLKRAAKPAFIFVSERGAPLHRALVAKAIAPAVGIAKRVAVGCWRKEMLPFHPRGRNADPTP